MNDDMQAAVKEVEAASRNLHDCHAATEIARSAETAALNRLNNAQRTLDGILSKMREAAPHGSDWRRRVATEKDGRAK